MNQYGSRKANESTYEQQIIRLLHDSNVATKEEIIEKTGCDKKTVTEYLSKMKSKNKIDKLVLYVPANKKISINVT